MESPGRFPEAVSVGPPERVLAESFAQATGGGEVWALLGEKLTAMAAFEFARQCRSASLNCELKEAVGKFAQRLVQRLVEIFRQATENLPETDQQVAARAAIDWLFAFDRPREYAGKMRTRA
ncbi:MAG: hypothetical protein AABY63_09810 [candidate division NC10 bacterium]